MAQIPGRHATGRPDFQCYVHSCQPGFLIQPDGIIEKDLFRSNLDKSGRKAVQVSKERGNIGMGQRMPVGICIDQPAFIVYLQERIAFSAGAN